MGGPLRILFYSWAPFDDPEGRGGGVSIYQRNLVEALIGRGHDVDVLSAGLAYDSHSLAPRIEPTENVFSPLCRSFRLVNSPVMAPGHAAYGQNRRLFQQGPADRVFHDFLTRQAPYDIVHFNTLEGIPLTFLNLRPILPQALVVVSHHNYFALCPQVNLWRQETRACEDFEDGRACEDCLVLRPDRAETLGAHQLATFLERAGFPAKSGEFQRIFAAGDMIRVLRSQAQRRDAAFLADDDPEAPDGLAAAFAWRRSQARALINGAVHLNLAVSARVAHILADQGIDVERTRVSYIGTRHAEGLATAHKRQSPARAGRLSLAYLGYMRADKGFDFLLDALEALPASLAKRLDLTIAARSNGDAGTEARLSSLARRLGGVRRHDGYRHDQLPRILADIDLGLVPAMWEDNLPQVAVEMMSHGLPLLTSDRGGAQELGGNPDFVFAAGSTQAFAAALERILHGKVALADFWTHAMTLPTMASHLDDLLALYLEGLQTLRGGPVRAAPRPPVLQGDDGFDLPATALLTWTRPHA